MKTYFFGVSDVKSKGHYLHREDGQMDWRLADTLPFNSNILDGGLLPKQGAEIQGELHLAVINGWTLLSMWDRSGDPRSASNAVFLAEGHHTMDEMRDIAAEQFPAIWKRIQEHQTN